MKTKSASTCSILGLLQPLPSTMLPTCSDVLLHHLYLTKLSSSNTTKWYTNSDISSTIRSIYKDASIPMTLSDAGIHKKIDILVAERQKLMKYKTPAKLANFQTRMKMLFVVTDEVPEIEKEFYMDQQTERLLHISCFMDLATTKTLQKKEQILDRREYRRQWDAARSERMTATKPEAVAEADLPSPRPETVAAADLSSSAESPRTSKTPAYFTTKIPLTAEAIARYGVSRRTTRIGTSKTSSPGRRYDAKGKVGALIT